jgi:hypothetical protein
VCFVPLSFVRFREFLMERLQKILSQAGIASRRASEQMMLDGRVTVNGKTVRELGTKADLSRDDIRVDGSRIKVAERHRYILLNKPRGYVTTRSDPERRKTVIDLLRGREGVRLSGRAPRLRIRGAAAADERRRPRARLTHPSHGIAGSTRRRCSASPTRTISSACSADGGSTAAGCARRR